MTHTPPFALPLAYRANNQIIYDRNNEPITFAAGEESGEAIVHRVNSHDALVEALEDMRAGWRYIRKHHGDLPGVGWDRAEQKAEAALAQATGEV